MIYPRTVISLCLVFALGAHCWAIELVTPTKSEPRYQLSNFRKEKDSIGTPVLAFDFKRTQKGDSGALFLKGKSANGPLSITATIPPWHESGTMQLRTFARPGSDLKVDIEIYVTRMHTVGENKYVYSMVSNAIRMGNPGAATTARPWTAEEKAGYQEYLRNKPMRVKRYAVTTDIPPSAVTVPKTAKLTKGTKLQACYQSKWYPITTLKENEDGSVMVRWDDWGEKYDCSMLRSELIIPKATLTGLGKHPASRFPDTPPSAAGNVASSGGAKKMDTTIPSSGKPRKDYPVSISVPDDSQFVPDDVTLPTGVPLQACYARKWNPITHLSHNTDGTLTVRWDDYGPTFDCSMVRKQLIIKKRDLQSLMNAPSTEARTWTDATGNFKIKAELVEQTSTHVTLLTEKGKRVTLPIGKLSQEDQDFLAGVTSQSANPFE